MSTDKIAIRVRHLGKKYSLGGPQEKYLTFRDTIVNSVKAPFKRLSSHESSHAFWALKDVSFDVEQGEVVGIIGRNGAGKSTLLKILSRITTPTEGTVELHGRVGSLLEVGTGFHPELTGRENIYLSGSILGMKRREIEAKLDDIVKFSEIEKFLDTPVKRYSSGMYVRLAFAVAAHMDTEILLIDEVLAVGDAQFQKKCLGKMGDVAAREGRTVLFVSHNMAVIRILCHSGIFLNEGRIAEQGKIADVTDSYLRTGADDLSWERNDTPQKDAYFEKVYFVDESGVILKEISPVGTVYLVIEFVLCSDLKNAKLAVNIKNRINDYICSSSPEDFKIVTPTEMGRYRATLRFPNNYLLFQNYGLEFSLYIPTKNVLDFITAINFSVKEIPSWSYSTEGRVGYFAIPSEWNITKIK